MGRLWYARWDRYPVSPGHLLLIPYRHVAGLFEATEEEMTGLPRLLCEAKAMVDGEFHPDGYNVGVNCGEAEGAVVPENVYECFAPSSVIVQPAGRKDVPPYLR